MPKTNKGYGNFQEAVNTELNRARTKFPNNKHMLAALTEEVGELNQAMIDHDCGTQARENIWKEAVQVAAMAQRIAEEGDSSFSY